MTAPRDDLAAFLLACIGEDEDSARDAAGWNKAGTERLSGRWKRVYYGGVDDEDDRTVVYSEGQPSREQADHIARWDPARVLAECAAKRRIVEEALANVKDARRRPGWTMPDDEVDEKGMAYRAGVEHQKAEQLPDTLDRTDRLFRQLALPYADRPGFRDEWRVS